MKMYSLLHLQADTIRVIFSFTDTDPEDITRLQYHESTNRGTKSVILLTYNDDGQTLPDNAISMDFLITEVCHFIVTACVCFLTVLNTDYLEIQIITTHFYPTFKNTLSRKRTTYWCEYLKVPQMEQKHHVVMVSTYKVIYKVKL